LQVRALHWRPPGPERVWSAVTRQSGRADMKYWIYLGCAILCEVTATSALKASEGFSRLWPSVTVIAGYGLSFYCLSLALRVIPIGVAYAIWAGLGIVLLSLVGWFRFHQKLDAPALLGMGLILSGVIVMRLWSSAGAH
jgi:small multidrug resistance pump